MAKTAVSGSKKRKVPTAPASKEDLKNVPVTQVFTGSTFKRLTKYKEDKALLFEQDVVRMAVAYFLDAVGY